MRGLAIVVLLVGLAVPELAVAQATDPGAIPSAPSATLGAAIERALLVIEGEPPASFFERIGAAGRDHLVTITRDATRPIALRRRAALGLGHYADPVSRAALEALLTDPAEDAVLARYALTAMERAFGASARDRILRALSDPRAVVREAAVLALVRVDPTGAPAVLSPLAAHEVDPVVLGAMRAATAR